MLRILGWNKKYIVIVTIIKSTLFNIIPGAIIGLKISSWITSELKVVILEKAKIDLDLEFNYEAVIVGLLCAFLLPILSMIQPLMKASNVELRDALDIYRRKANDVTVQFTKLESKFGLSFNQLVMGILFTSYGVIAFVLIPNALIVQNSSGKAFFWLMSIFSALVVGLVGIA